MVVLGRGKDLGEFVSFLKVELGGVCEWILFLVGKCYASKTAAASIVLAGHYREPQTIESPSTPPPPLRNLPNYPCAADVQ